MAQNLFCEFIMKSRCTFGLNVKKPQTESREWTGPTNQRLNNTVGYFSAYVPGYKK